MRNRVNGKSVTAGILVLCLFLSITSAFTQNRVSVGFYNVENFFDTIPSGRHDDSDYTPDGRYRWDAVRYERKLLNIARVIDDAGFDVIALAEVESEVVLHDLIRIVVDDYNYIFSGRGDRRGINQAMLYKGDKFFPERSCMIRSGYSRGFLHVRGTLIGDTVSFLVCHMPSKYNKASYRAGAMKRLAEVADSLVANDKDAKLILMGDFNAESGERIFRNAFGVTSDGYYTQTGLYDCLWKDANSGYGTYCWNEKWVLYDHMLVSSEFNDGTGLRFDHGGIFVRDYMLVPNSLDPGRRGYPWRTFSGNRYLGGYSDHLPIYAVFYAK